MVKYKGIVYPKLKIQSFITLPHVVPNVKLRLNHWCHMDYFNDLFAMFLSLGRVRILAVYGGPESSRKYLNLCSEDERRSCRFGTTWGRVINDIIFGWTIPLSPKTQRFITTSRNYDSKLIRSISMIPPSFLHFWMCRILKLYVVFMVIFG